MAFSDTTYLRTYLGNGSTSTRYPVPFKLMSPSHLKVEVQASGASAPTLLGPGQYVYGTDGVSAWVTTAVTYPNTTRVIVRRELPLDQPFEFPNGGAFSARDVERALDRIVQQIIQTAAKSGNGFTFADTNAVSPLVRTPNTLVGFDLTGQPNARTAAQILSWLGITTSTVTPSLPIFYNAAEREAAHAGEEGRLCVQLDNLSVWMSVTGYGDYQYLHLVSNGPQAFDNAALRLLATPAQSGQLGVQLDTLEVWMGTGTTPGAWRLVSGAEGRPPAHSHAAPELHSLPYFPPRTTAGLAVPLGEPGGRLGRCVSLDVLADLGRVPRSARNTVLALGSAGVVLTEAQLQAIGAFYTYAESSGLLSVNGPKARLLFPVWANNLTANVLDWLHPDGDTQPTPYRFDGGAGGAFLMPGGSIASDVTTPAAAGYLNLRARASEQWLANNWCYAFYTHAAPVGNDNALLGGRNDAESGGGYRYFATVYGAAGAIPNGCRFSPGYTGGDATSFLHGGTGPGLCLAGMHNTNVLRTRQLKAAGFVAGSTQNVSGSAATAILTPLSMMGLAYMPSTPPSGQPCSLLYSGYLPGSTSADCDAFATALRTLLIALGAPSV